ncbi:hypothetical protein BU24DRAFT_225679 [Aaosphaeria arxii CBS 175.79]|uniref:Small ribosomal subunit protein mS38 n=1 Tax=Aaosphaeria arxii CBS 175.79 TaxID=1450172 RepID=A0A6A5XPX0_9PLEO|nr:uncharacterized protein BU24DRAFT_225679 [Aaosphaeria arxii CBS 175.79]KAF2014956.1 hypothetical protein BU24DRAFT_225679 [Aaosphaeria arxii CBS 175.79]
MFSPVLGRAVRSTSSIATPSVCITLGRPATFGAVNAQQSFSRPAHQRRLSSSKASIPPDGSNGSSSTQQTPGTSTNKAPARKLTGRASKKRAQSPPALNVPHVPPTDYLQKPEVKISSFFSLHRPISVTSAIPPVSTSASFDSIFQTRNPHSRKAMVDNMQTLSSGIESLEAALRVHEKQSPEEMVQSELEVQHLDGPPQVSVDQIMSRFVPFRPPPAPVPFDQAAQPETGVSQRMEAPAAASIKQRSWSTAVVVTESTDASGQRTYSATTAPMVEIEAPAAENSLEMEDIEIRQPFLERMRRRQNTNSRPDMMAISVKRQRKLKMKKHKYKKLMKRTRLLRRKLDRA